MKRIFTGLTLITCLCLFSCVADESDYEAAESWESVPPSETAETDTTSETVEAIDMYQVKFETSKGDVVIEVHPEWAPIGAAHFKELVEAGYYNEVRFFRVIDGFMAQFGMTGDPQLNGHWRDKNLKDEPVKQSNTRGMVTYAKTGAPNSRSTQIFINFGDNSFLDQQGFSPFGKVIEGMEIVDSFYSGYGESPDQGQIGARGNSYLLEKFPKLDYIKQATVIE